MLGTKKIECSTEGCHRYYDGEDYGVEITWHCDTCQTYPNNTRLFERRKTKQVVLRSASTNRTRFRYWMRWLRKQE